MSRYVSPQMMVLPTMYAGDCPKLNFAYPLCLASLLSGIQVDHSSSALFNLIIGSCWRRKTKGRTLISGRAADLATSITPRRRHFFRRSMLVSSRVSLTTVSLRLLSLISRLPPGRLICPDQGSVERSTLFTKRASRSERAFLSNRATAASAACSSVKTLRVLASFSIWLSSGLSLHHLNHELFHRFCTM
jgi:hypothetical protein